MEQALQRLCSGPRGHLRHVPLLLLLLLLLLLPLPALHLHLQLMSACSSCPRVAHVRV